MAMFDDKFEHVNNACFDVGCFTFSLIMKCTCLGLT